MPPPPTGVRPPQQQRSRESLERVLRAGEKLLADRGYEGFTMAEVARTARLSVGSVYGRFENKDALVYAIHRRMLERLGAVSAGPGVEAEAGLAEAVAHAVRRLADRMHVERRLLRVFMLRGAVDANIAQAGSRSSQAAAGAFTDAVLDRPAEIGHADPQLAADIAFRMVYDVLARQIMYGPTFESPRPVAWDTLVAELSGACVAYLRRGANGGVIGRGSS
jgi:AcrR family transcriptional regulator